MKPALVVTLAATLAACASPEQEAAYQRTMERWRGASTEQLIAAWGAPGLVETLPGGDKALTWVVRHDWNNTGRTSATTDVGLRAGTMAGTPGIKATTAGVMVAPTAPITCTTRFVVHNGLVSSWTFKGVGCGAPDE